MAIEMKRRLFTVEEFQAMGRAGILTEDDRVELLDGEIVEMPPIGSAHGGTVNKMANLLKERLGRRIIVGVQNPILLNDLTEPLPDITLLKPRPDYYRQSHPVPVDVLLLIEVADTTVRQDRHVKGPLYARSGVKEYWLADLEADLIEVYRQPSAQGYGEVRQYRRGQSVAPLAFPEMAVAVEDLLGA